MSELVRHAILDTDFVSKANIIQSKNRVLADEVLEFPGYRFYCHQKMRQELGDHGTRASQGWLDHKITEGDIRCYDDEQIIQELKSAAGEYCFAYYRSFLKSPGNNYLNDYDLREFRHRDDLGSANALFY